MANHNGHENARSDWSITHLLFPKWVYNGKASARLNYDCARKSAQFDQWRQIVHRKSRSVLSVRFSVVN